LGIGFLAFPALAGDIHTTTLVPNPCSAGQDGEPADAGANPPYTCAR
jgi:hypothetical protein